MRNEDKLIKIPLQFFGEDAEELDEDFDEWDDEDDPDYDDADPDEEDGGGEDDTDDGDDKSDEDEEDGTDADGGENADGDGKKDEGDEQSDTDALIAELKAAGYEGDDIKALTADVKKKRESAAAAERRAANKEGKGHVKSGKPTRSASGDGMAGFDRRDVEEMRRAIGPNCTEERARRALEKRIRANAR